MTLREKKALADAEGLTGLANTAATTVKQLPKTVEAQARFRSTPKQQVDLLLKALGTGLSVKKLAQTPGGADLGPLEPRLPQRLYTEDKLVHLGQPLITQAIAALDAAGATAHNGVGDELLLIGRRAQRDNNSWLHNVPRLTSGKPRHRLFINPADAADRAIEDGDVVDITSAAGKVSIDCHVTDEVMPGVVCLPHGYGHGKADGIRLEHAKTLAGVSFNELSDPQRTEAITGNAILNGIPVGVSRAD